MAFPYMTTRHRRPAPMTTWQIRIIRVRPGFNKNPSGSYRRPMSEFAENAPVLETIPVDTTTTID